MSQAKHEGQDPSKQSSQENGRDGDEANGVIAHDLIKIMRIIKFIIIIIK
jgi:hypothetical protein